MFYIHPHNLWVFSLTALLPRLKPTVTHLSASQVMVCQLVRGGVGREKAGGEWGSNLLVSLPLLVHHLRAPLLSWAQQCCICGIWVAVNRGRDGEVWGGVQQGEVGWGPKVTVAGPPSLTVRTPSPHPLHLEANGRTLVSLQWGSNTLFSNAHTFTNTNWSKQGRALHLGQVSVCISTN